MQLVIIAGGLGTRLRPLTYRTPKALLPLLNRPQILHLLDGLPDAIEEVLVPVNHGFEEVRAFFADHDAGRAVTVVHEASPLGTGGALRNVGDRLEGPFAAFNGDVVNSVDVADLLRVHAHRTAVGTLVVAPVEDPSPFGVVAVDGDRVTAFVEKPPRGKAPSDLVNAGRYVLEPEALDAIEPGRAVSLEREVFPRLVGKGLFAYRHEGPWSDAGTRETYLRAQALLLAAGGAGVASDADVARGELREPVLVGPGSFVEGRVGPDAVVGAGCRIGRASVADSALFPGSSVDDKAEVRGSILGSGVAVGEGAVVRDCIVADGVQVPPRARKIEERVAA